MTQLIKQGRRPIKLDELTIAIKGAGEIASAVAWRLFMAHMKKTVMLELPDPIAVRRRVSFCEAVHEGKQTVEGVDAVPIWDPAEVRGAWETGKIAVAADPEWKMLKTISHDVLIDAVLAKKNLGTRMDDAELVIGLGPGFCAGHDVHLVVETNRGHHLGKIIASGSAQPNTGIPGQIGGFAEERVLRAPVNGQFHPELNIGDPVKKDDVVGAVSGTEVRARIDGVLRGAIRAGTRVPRGLKIADVDPRGVPGYCDTISDKARAISGSVLEAVLRVFG